MKLLVVADIHSNRWSLDAILRAEPRFDVFCCAGDIVDYGTTPREVIATIQGIAPKSLVQGNHDLLVAKTFREDRLDAVAPRNFKWVHHNCKLLTESDIEYLESLPIRAAFHSDGWDYLLQHQCSDDYETIEHSRQFDDYWRRHTPPAVWNAPRRRMIFGHSHRQCVHQLGTGMEWINPGSTSYRRPDDPDKTAHYAVVEDGIVTLKRVPYDRSELFAEAERYHDREAMMETELQDFYFFFGPAVTSREQLPQKTGAREFA